MADSGNQAPAGDTSNSGQPNGANAPAGDKGEGNGEGSQPFDIKSLPKEAWDQIYQSGRFKELNEKAKLADQLKKEKSTAEEAALKEQGKWKELAEKADQRVKAVESSAIASEIKAFAAKYGAHDLNDIAALASREAVKFEDGVVTGAEDAVKALVESKPHLFNTNNSKPRVGTGTNPGDANNQGVPKFTHSQIKDPAFWAKHETEIMQALRNGTVVDDTK